MCFSRAGRTTNWRSSVFSACQCCLYCAKAKNNSVTSFTSQLQQDTCPFYDANSQKAHENTARLSDCTSNTTRISQIRFITGPDPSVCACETFPNAALGRKAERENTTATLNAVMQMFSHLRAVEDLEPLPLPEAEVILGPGFVVIKSHKQSHPCRKTKSVMCWLELELAWMKDIVGIFIVVLCYCCCRRSAVRHMGCRSWNSEKSYRSLPFPLLLGFLTYYGISIFHMLRTN